MNVLKCKLYDIQLNERKEEVSKEEIAAKVKQGIYGTI
jgi:hypothetical protein